MIVTPEFPEHRLQDPRRQAEWRVYQEIAGSRPPAAPSTRCGPGSTCRSLISAFGCRTSPTTASR